MNNKNHIHKVTDPWSFEEDHPSVPLDRTSALTAEETLELQLELEELQIVLDETVPEESKDEVKMVDKTSHKTDFGKYEHPNNTGKEQRNLTTGATINLAPIKIRNGSSKPVIHKNPRVELLS